MKAAAGVVVASLVFACGTSGPAPDVASFTDGDYEAVAFSPTGRYLALANQGVLKGQVLSQIVLYDLDRRHLDTLISREAAAAYAAYSATVYRLEWVSDSAFVASYSDGDVEGTEILLLANGRRVSEQPIEAEPEERPPALVDSLARLYPEVATPGSSPAEVFDAALGWPFIHGRDFVVLQKKHFGTDKNIWLFRTRQRHAEVIQVLPDSSVRYGLVGGFTQGNDLVVASGGDSVTLYRWRAGQLRPLRSFQSFWQHAELRVRDADTQRTGFVLQLAGTLDRRRGLVFMYEEDKLSQLAPELDTADADVHLGRRIIALTVWRGKERHVRVRRL